MDESQSLLINLATDWQSVHSDVHFIQREVFMKIPKSKSITELRSTLFETFDEVIAVARQMRPRSMANHLKGTVKEILGN